MAEPMVEGRREKRKRELRARIYEVAQGLFLAQGFEKTTVEQIADAADVVPATFFNHFQNKNALLREMTSEVIDQLQEMLEEHFSVAASTRERLMGFIAFATDQIVESRGVAHDVLLELVRADSSPDGTPPYLAQVHEPFATLFREGQERGDVRADQDPSFMAEMVVGMLNAPVAHWLSDANFPIEKRLPAAGSFAWEAISVRHDGS
ncbi:MAG: TetR/AcrR family transcriptional regulator [bacterium]|nr:TetR/AcrR family transcriptional regulator [bacterium]MCP5067646.1 TetR/AcrR family transcriptional regulator [bacterium]